MPKFHRLNLNVRIEVVPKVVEREMMTTITLLVYIRESTRQEVICSLSEIMYLFLD